MTFIARLPSRPPSRAARWALRFAVLCLVLTIAALLAHRGGMMGTQAFLLALAALVPLAIVTLLLVLAGMRSLWLRGSKGGRRLAWAVFIMLPLMAPLVFGAVLAVRHPAGAEATTDPADPPGFGGEVRGPFNAGRSSRAELAGLRYNAPIDAVLAAIGEVAEARRWREVGRRGRIGADDQVFVQYAHRTPVLYMPIEIVVRIADEGDTSFIDARARMPHVPHDLGATARLTETFLADLDFAMIGRVDS